MRTATPLLFAAFLFAVSACGDGTTEPAGDGKSPARHAASTEGGKHVHSHALPLGKTRLGPAEFEVTQLGSPAAGTEIGFMITPLNDAARAEGATVQVWVQNDAGDDIAPVTTAPFDGKGYHCHVQPAAEKGKPVRVMLQFRHGDLEDRAGLDLALGFGPHDGILAFLSGGDRNGLLELKLHDDKGDLELWLTTQDGRPFDLPLDTAVLATFLGPESRTAALAVRNSEKNEDEDGRANIREGRTNYFIFPGATGTDASWLQGAGFSATVIVKISADGAEFASLPFRLVPHTHGAGHTHSHGGDAGHEH
jgi:hypothetical protein